MFIKLLKQSIRLEAIVWMTDYLVDFVVQMMKITMVCKLQGDKMNLIKTADVIAVFAAMLLLFNRNLGRDEYNHFSTLDNWLLKTLKYLF